MVKTSVSKTSLQMSMLMLPDPVCRHGRILKVHVESFIVTYFIFYFDIKTQYILCSLCLRYSVRDAGYMHTRVGVVLVLVHPECD